MGIFIKRTKSPVPYLTDIEFLALPVQERALQIASSWVGQREIGKNAGPFVTRLLAAVGLGPGFPWCASLVSAVLQSAGSDAGPTSGRAAVRNWARWGAQTGRVTATPTRGCLFYWLHENGTGHIGFVTEVLPDKTFRSIEGNTNDAGSREGDGTYRRIRPINKATKFLRWWE